MPWLNPKTGRISQTYKPGYEKITTAQAKAIRRAYKEGVTELKEAGVDVSKITSPTQLAKAQKKRRKKKPAPPPPAPEPKPEPVPEPEPAPTPTPITYKGYVIEYREDLGGWKAKGVSGVKKTPEDVKTLIDTVTRTPPPSPTSINDLIAQAHTTGVEQAREDILARYAAGKISKSEMDATLADLNEAHLEWMKRFKESGPSEEEIKQFTEARAAEQAAVTEATVKAILGMEAAGEITHEQSIEAIKHLEAENVEKVKEILSGEDVHAGESKLSAPPPIAPSKLRTIDEIVTESRVTGYENALAEQLRLWGEGKISKEEFNRRAEALGTAHLQWAAEAEARDWAATEEEYEAAQQMIADAIAKQTEETIKTILSMEATGKITHDQSVKAIDEVKAGNLKWQKTIEAGEVPKGIRLVTKYKVGDIKYKATITRDGVEETKWFDTEKELDTFIKAEQDKAMKAAGWTGTWDAFVKNQEEVKAGLDSLISQGVVKETAEGNYEITKYPTELTAAQKELAEKVGFNIEYSTPWLEQKLPWLADIRKKAKLKEFKRYEDMTDREKEELFAAMAGSVQSVGKETLPDLETMLARLEYASIYGVEGALVGGALTAAIAAVNAAVPGVGLPISLALIGTQLASLRTKEAQRRFLDHVKSNPEAFVSEAVGGILGSATTAKIIKTTAAKRTAAQKAQLTEIKKLMGIMEMSPEELKTSLKNIGLTDQEIVGLVDELGGPYMRGVFKSQKVPTELADILKTEVDPITGKEMVVGRLTRPGEVINVPAAQKYGGDLFTRLMNGEAIGPEAVAETIMKELTPEQLGYLAAKGYDLPTMSLMTGQQLADVMWKELGPLGPWANIPEGITRMAGGEMKVIGVVSPLTKTESEALLGKGQIFFNDMVSGGVPRQVALQITQIAMEKGPVAALVFATASDMLSEQGVSVVSNALAPLASSILTLAGKGSHVSTLKELGLSDEEVLMVQSRLIESSSVKPVINSLKVLKDKSLKNYMATVNQDLLLESIPKLDPNVIAKVAPNLDTSTVVKLAPKLDPKVLSSLAVSVSKEQLDDVLKSLTKKDLNDSLKKFDDKTLKKIASELEIKSIEGILPKLDFDAMKKIFPKLDFDKKAIQNALAKMDSKTKKNIEDVLVKLDRAALRSMMLKLNKDFISDMDKKTLREILEDFDRETLEKFVTAYGAESIADTVDKDSVKELRNYLKKLKGETADTVVTAINDNVLADIVAKLDKDAKKDLVTKVNWDKIASVMKRFSAEGVAKSISEFGEAVDAETLAKLLSKLDKETRRRAFSKLDEKTLVRVLPELDKETATEAFRQIDTKLMMDALAKLNRDVAADVVTDIIPDLSKDTIIDIIPTLDKKTITDIVPTLDSDTIQKILPELDAETATDVITMLDAATLTDVIPKLDEPTFEAAIPDIDTDIIVDILPTLDTETIVFVIDTLTEKQLPEIRTLLERNPRELRRIERRLTPSTRARFQRASRRPPAPIPRSPKPEPYRVSFDYPTGASESKSVSAHSFQEALTIAEGQKQIKLDPLEVEVEKLALGTAGSEEQAPAGTLMTAPPSRGPKKKKPKKLKKKPKRKRRPGPPPGTKPGPPPGRKKTTPKTRTSGGKKRYKKEGKDPRRKRTSHRRSRLVK